MELGEMRTRIDRINAEIVSLFAERMGISLEVARYKSANSLPVMDTGREREILRRVTELAGEDMEVYTRILFSTILNLSRSYQNSVLKRNSALAGRIREALENTPKRFPQKAVVACQGIEGAYSQIACDKLFAQADIMYFSRFESVFQAVEKGMCKYGILPVENSTFGSVGEVHDLMRKHNFYIINGLKLKVYHALLAKPGVKLADIREIYSHEQGIGQCGAFLEANPQIKATVCENTAIAARMVAESGRTDVAAISSKHCADLYALSVLSEDIQSRGNNYTRFICISRDLEIYPGANRISMMMTLPHRPGSLYELISRFSALGLNMTKLESRPIPEKDFEFMFYVDMEAPVYSDDVTNLLDELESGSEQFRFLGAYMDI